MPSVSLCMIVKNEESLLPQCFDSVKGWVDEIIVVDTGSTDKTIEIAERHDAVIYHHPWENDFSKHRNQSLGYATGDWILILDADEKIENGHGDRIKKLLAGCPEDITKIYLIVKDIQKNQTAMVSQSIRLFRNNIGIHYQGIVHNKIIAPSGKSIKSDIVLYHYGYGLCEEDMDRKFHRTHSLLLNQLEENPNDLFALYNMATELQNRAPQKSIDYGVRLLSLLKQKNKVPVFYVNIFYVLAVAYVQLKAIDKAIDICLEAINIFPKYVDAYWILCECCFEKDDYDRVILYGNRFFHFIDYYENHPEELSELFVYSYDQTDKVSLRLGLSYIYADDWIRAVPHLNEYIDKQESKSDAVDTIIGHLKTHHNDYEQINDKINKLMCPDCLEEKQPAPIVSLCMMVKNEEEMLPRCLDSVKSWVDEIIIVDTGSTDMTVEIAKCYDAKVYHHPWENDFSKHRNQSISYAAGDWILIMDADEVLRSGDGHLIREAIERDDIDSIMVPVVNYFNNQMGQGYNNQVRIFRNNMGFHYKGIVHNRFVGSGKETHYPIYINHFGYDLDPEKIREKYNRTSTLLKKKIKDDPNDYIARSQLSANYAGCGMFEAAIEEGMRSIELANKDIEKGGDVNLWTHFIVASASVNLGHLKEAEEIALEALRLCPIHLDSCFILSVVYHRLRDWKQFNTFSDDYYKLLSMLKTDPGKFGNMVNTTANEAWRIHAAYGEFYLEQGKYEPAVLSFKRALEKRPDDVDLNINLALAYKHLGRINEAIEHNRKALSINANALEALTNLGHLYYDLNRHEDSLQMYELAIDIEPGIVDILLRLTWIKLLQGDVDGCAAACEAMLTSLNINCNMTLTSLHDLAEVFLVIAKDLKSNNRISLYQQAIEFADRINPNLKASPDIGNTELMETNKLW